MPQVSSRHAKHRSANRELGKGCATTPAERQNVCVYIYIYKDMYVYMYMYIYIYIYIYIQHIETGVCGLAGTTRAALEPPLFLCIRQGAYAIPTSNFLSEPKNIVLVVGDETCRGF